MHSVDATTQTLLKTVSQLQKLKSKWTGLLLTQYILTMANIIEYEENDAWPDGKDSLQHKNEPHICTYWYILVIKFCKFF